MFKHWYGLASYALDDPLNYLPKVLIKKGKGQRVGTRIGNLLQQLVHTDDPSDDDPMAADKAMWINQDTTSQPSLFMIMGTSLTLPGPQKMVKKISTAMHLRNKNSLEQESTTRKPSYLDIIQFRTANSAVLYINHEAPPASMTAYIDVWIEGDVQEWSRRLRRMLHS